MSANNTNDDSPIGNLHAGFQFAVHQREFEISQLTQRNNFFMVFQGVLIAGLVQSQGVAAPIISFAVCIIGFVMGLFQVGMAAGSKYWQMRWERAAKTTEIWLLQALKDEPRVSNFLTADGNYLTTSEMKALDEINKRPARANDQIEHDLGAIKTATESEMAVGPQIWRRRLENWLILRKYSVSRIPLWVGVALSAFWLCLLPFTVAVNLSWWHPSSWIHLITLVPFKA